MNLKSIIKQLIVEQQKHIIDINAQKHTFCGSASLFNREFKTVGLTTARQSGKTSTIIDMWRPGDLVITHNTQMAEYLQRLNIHARSVSKVISKSMYGIEQRYNYIFIDEDGYMHRDDLHDIYACTRADWYVKLSS